MRVRVCIQRVILSLVVSSPVVPIEDLLNTSSPRWLSIACFVGMTQALSVS